LNINEYAAFCTPIYNAALDDNVTVDGWGIEIIISSIIIDALHDLKTREHFGPSHDGALLSKAQLKTGDEIAIYRSQESKIQRICENRFCSPHWSNYRRLSFLTTAASTSSALPRNFRPLMSRTTARAS